VYLYGRLASGDDLPGSPLVQVHTAKSAPSRANLADGANFLLPKSWTAAQSVTFEALATKADGSGGTSATLARSFNTRRTPLYWTIPLNYGTAASPNLASNTTMDTQESYMRAVFPVPSIRIVRKPWQDIGALNASLSADQAKAKVKDYYGQVGLAWVLSLIFSGKPPFDLPEMIYGFRPSGGGTSDPVWLGGDGRVAVGALGATSVEGVLAHEFNHNLDRRPAATATWGYHVGGCTADASDTAWPYGNVNTNEIGFDTRLPWNQTASDKTAIPSNVPDLMSYCQSGFTPTKWISPYRWQRWFENFAPSLEAQSAIPLDVLATNMYYLSGRVTVSGTGELNPVLVQPGLPTENIAPGEFALEFLNASNVQVGAPISFTAVFTDYEGEVTPEVSFSFIVPERPDTQKIVLKRGAVVLSEIARSNNAPAVTVTAPGNGETISGTYDIRWSASDADGDPLTFSILYSPDNGSTWQPVASNVTGTVYSADTSVWAAGNQGKVRVIITDGFNTTQDDSDGIFVKANSTPIASIIAPAAGAQAPVNTPIPLQGSGFDAEDANLPDTAFIWSYTPASGGSPMAIGVGHNTSASLPEGEYVIMLTVTDSVNASGASQVYVNVSNGYRLFIPVLAK
jgi:hypothetical protein